MRWSLVEPPERYRTFSRFLRERYGGKVWKIPVDAGFSCPNRDGTRGHDGCTFCRQESFNPMPSRQAIEVAAQIEAGIRLARQRFGIDKFIVYFQTASNTHAPVATLNRLFEQAIAFPGVVGLDISTRPDCLGPEILELLAGFAARTDLWVEVGLQSIHDRTLSIIHRGHTYQEYLDAVGALQRLPVRICTHLILGLPGEDAEMMRQTATAVARVPIHEIKLHPLLILEGTAMAAALQEGRVEPLSLEDYAALVVDFIERMPEDRVLQRMTAEAPAGMLIAPRWALEKHQVRRAVNVELVKRGSRQGCRFHQKALS
ncbi:MAG TPA: TIGR01212 family radical SAM protein [bacterium]|nr:TIGR01212 family radical SAM protein [bacterium]HQI48407.1 TIGR01212 family radical SAM protein [bacterium]HQJ63233.1 TIGR01212 family radical SAM protein [bacterium]